MQNISLVSHTNELEINGYGNSPTIISILHSYTVYASIKLSKRQRFIAFVKPDLKSYFCSNVLVIQQ